MSLPRQLRQTIIQNFDLEELKNICFDLSFNYDDLPGDRLSSKVNALLIVAYKMGKLDKLHQYLTIDRPEAAWPTHDQIQDFKWDDIADSIELPQTIINNINNVQSGGVQNQGDVIAKDQVAGNKIVQNIVNNYSTGEIGDITPMLAKIRNQFSYIQIFYFAGTGALSFLALSMILSDWGNSLGQGSRSLLVLIILLYLSFGAIPGAAYGFVISYFGSTIYREKFNVQFLLLNMALFGISFMLIPLTRSRDLREAILGFIVGAAFGFCLVLPWWLRSVNDRFSRVLITVILCVSISFWLDYFLGFPVTSLANPTQGNEFAPVNNAVISWIIFGGSLSFYYAIWPHDLAQIFKLREDDK
ncbi:MAG: hypothetical protein AAF902_07660 [Chloroflexota bacterium]